MLYSHFSYMVCIEQNSTIQNKIIFIVLKNNNVTPQYKTNNRTPGIVVSSVLSYGLSHQSLPDNFLALSNIVIYIWLTTTVS